MNQIEERGNWKFYVEVGKVSFSAVGFRSFRNAAN
jgi:hypothetical protein